MSSNKVECPRCGGCTTVTDWSRCGPSCRSESPPERACGLCGGCGAVDQDTADEYDDSRNYEQESDEAAQTAAWDAREEARRDSDRDEYYD